MNPLKLFPARSGDLTARWNERQLHSRFDPRAEADRFLDSGPGIARVFVVIGPGLGYLISSIRRRYPHARVLALALSPELSQHLVESSDALWTPESDLALTAFLSRHISDLATASVAVLEWAPVTDTFRPEADAIRAAVSAHLRTSQASLVTQGATGRRWLRNRIFNYVHANPCRPIAADRQVCAVALVTAGPSLEKALARIEAHRDTLDVWATGSAFDALVSRGIRPDMVVVTDASLYAAEHIRKILTAGDAEVPVAAPLCATRALAGSERLLVLSENDSVDRALLGGDRSIPVIPPHGTVTATCALLIRALTPAPILLIGADFAWLEDRSHARPHLSEVYRQKNADRLNPASNQVYESSRLNERIGSGWATSQSLRTYAQWFEAEAKRRLAPVFALDPSPVLRGIPELDPRNIRQLSARFPGIGWTPAELTSSESRAATARAYLERVRETAATARQPETGEDLETVLPEIAELAVRLCLPDLLRWDRSSGDERPTAWETVIASVTQELDSCQEFLA